MNRPFASIVTALLLTTTPGAFAAPAAPAKAPQDKPEASNEFEAQMLRTAETKLAALANEAKEANAPVKEAKAKPAKKVKAHAAARKRSAKLHLMARPKGNPTAEKIVNRRLTEGEVKGILTTTRDFSGSDLSGMNLMGVDLTGVKFNRANLHMANLERANLAETDLELADLSGANLRGASLNQARLRGTRLEGTRMDGALWIDKTVCKSGSLGSCIE
jgi:uncharacterized protein YjbI with pentapeptide repeats